MHLSHRKRNRLAPGMRRWVRWLVMGAPPGYLVAVKTYQLVLALPFTAAFGVAGHALLSRGTKTVLWAWAPLASGEPEAATYERLVYHTAETTMTQVVVAAAACGLLPWIGLATGSALWWWLGMLALAGVVALDVWRWERVAVSGHNLWFQRGFHGKVHQVDLENIRDASIEEKDAGGLTLRHGRHNRVVRLQVRMNDKRVIALPKTDAERGLAGVEAVANFLRMRIEQIRDRELARRPRPTDLPPPGALSETVDAKDEDLRRALARLRKRAAKPPVASGSAL
jgi:hypothetical protein